MTDQATTKSAGAPAWMKMALVASLVVNVAVVGLFLGLGMKEDRPTGGANQQIKWILTLVPEDRQEFTEDKFEARRDELRKTRADGMRHMRAIVTAIRAEPFSPEAMEYAMRLRREAGDVRRKIVHTELIAVLQEFDTEERSLFADRLEERLKKWMQQK